MAELCPICGRTIGFYTGDPLYTTPSLSIPQYEGYSQLIRQHIEELQTERHQQEIDIGVTPLTEFSPINNTGFFQNIKQYILELRSSTQKILDINGITLSEFLSNDEEGNLITAKSDWTDNNIAEIDTKYQCKAIHIEDLRHFISSEIILLGTSAMPVRLYSLQSGKNLIVKGYVPAFPDYPSNPVHPWVLCKSNTQNYIQYADSQSTLDITVDEYYLWSLTRVEANTNPRISGERTELDSLWTGGKFKILARDSSTDFTQYGALNNNIGTIFISTGVYILLRWDYLEVMLSDSGRPRAQYLIQHKLWTSWRMGIASYTYITNWSVRQQYGWGAIACDKNYIYINGANDSSGGNLCTTIYKYNKESRILDIIYAPTTPTSLLSGLGIDNNYIYFLSTMGEDENGNQKAIVRLKKDGTSSLFARFGVEEILGLCSSVVATETCIYVLDCYPYSYSYLRIFNKSDLVLKNSYSNIEGDNLIISAPWGILQNKLASTYEYRQTLS